MTVTTIARRRIPGRFGIGIGMGLGLGLSLVTVLGSEVGAGEEEGIRIVAELRDGQRETGALIEIDGKVVFRPDSGGEPISMTRLSRVVRPEDENEGVTREPTDPWPFLVSTGLDDRISGRLIEVDANSIRLAVGPDGEELTVDRRGASWLIQRPGESQVFADRFDEEDVRAGWTLGDGTRVDSGDLKIEPGGSEARLTLPEPVDAGRVELTFSWGGRQERGHRWFVDLIFDGPNGEEVTRVVLGWADEFPSIESRGGPEIVVQPLILEPGMHRLSARFGPARTLLAIDGNDLGRGGGIRGSLRSIRFQSESARDAEPLGDLRGKIDDLLVIRTFEPTTSPEIDPSQDELRLVSGDQIWGTILSADDQKIRIEVVDRPIDFPWSQVAGIYFERKAASAEPIEGPILQAVWDVGDPDGVPDRIEGVLVEVVEDRFRIRAPYSGTIEVPRDRLRELERLGSGRLLVLDPFERHLGDQIMPEFDPPFPDGDSHEVRFTLDSVPDRPAILVIDAIHVEGEFSGGRFTDEIRDGYQRTNVLFNGEQFDYLNRFVKDANRVPSRLRIPVPADRLVEGENVLRFEQLGREDDPSYRDDLGVLRIALEWPEEEDETSP